MLLFCILINNTQEIDDLRACPWTMPVLQSVFSFIIDQVSIISLRFLAAAEKLTFLSKKCINQG